MPYSNVLELEACLDDCIRYCEEHPDAEYAKLFMDRLKKTRRNWYRSVELSDEQHRRWRTEQRQGRIAWKKLAHDLREVQRELRRVGAIDFPNVRVMYWDEDRLLTVIEAMKSYLAEHADDLEFASDFIERFDRNLGVAASEEREANNALKDYQRVVDLRRATMNDITADIREFRIALRRALGRHHPEYQSIKWPYVIASDEGVLF